MGVVKHAADQQTTGTCAVAVPSHDKPAFYMVSPDRYKTMLKKINDLHLVRLAKERLTQKDLAAEVTLEDL